MFNNKKNICNRRYRIPWQKVYKDNSFKWKPEKIIVYSRDELKFEMQKYWPTTASFNPLFHWRH